MKKININDTITIFGGNGFIGNYLVKELASTGARIKIVTRNPEVNDELKVCGAVGQITLIYGDITSFKDIEANIKGSTYVINLVGIFHEKGKNTFNNIHVQAAKNIALSCFNNNVKRLIHVSALGIDRNFNSKYASSKLEGEREALRIFPNSVAVRPSVVFGPEDNFINLFNRISRLSPILPLIGGGETRFQPVYVLDVAKAIAKCLTLEDEKICGKIIELGGSKTYSLRDIYQLILRFTKRKRILLSLPYSLAKVMAFFLGLLPSPLLTLDQVELLKTDNVLKNSNALEDLNITPTNMEAIISRYLR
jgi:NADH dehydrogenase